MQSIRNRLIQIPIKISNLIQKIKANNFERNLVNTCLKFNTTGKEHLWEMINLFKKIFKNKVQGDFVECGVWRGAYLVLFQKLIEEYNLENLKIYGYDTFVGMPEPTTLDKTRLGKSMKEQYQE